MSDERDDKPGKQQPELALQDYLDTLLAPTSAPASPQVEMELLLAASERVALPSNVRRFAAKGDKSVAAAPSSTKLGLPKVVPPPAANEPRADDKPTPPTESTSKPFAPAKKPLAFSLPKLAPMAPAQAPTPMVEPQIAKVAAEEIQSWDIGPGDTDPLNTGVAPPSVPGKHDDAASEAAMAESVERVAEPALTEWLANGRPRWGQQPFECLLFTAGGLMLAVPLVELGTIYPLQDDLTHLFGQADWFMGLLSVKGRTIRAADTAKLVMPERYRPDITTHYKFVLSLNGLDWGLAIDDVSKAITLHPDQVKWRGQRGKRPWLAGTVVDHMCALMDVSQLLKIFAAQSRR